MTGGAPFWGKYRGTVVNNLDPMQTGRLQVIVPDVSGVMLSSWAMPCAPVAGMQSGMFALPIIGSGVWVEFEGGDPDYPIWVGCFWGTAAEVPSTALLVPPAVPGITLQTPLQNAIQISDTPGVGGIMLKNATGAMLLISEVGVTMTNGKGATISMVGPTLDFNAGALTVT